MSFKCGLITGTGFYTLPGYTREKTETVKTPYGTTEVESGAIYDIPVVFIPRHGKQHSIVPSEINYRANLFAFHLLGVEHVLATSVSGSLNEAWPPGTLVLMEQFLNFTQGRKDTFPPRNGKIAHIDVTLPYCPTIGSIITAKAAEQNIPLETGGTYACTNGPRFETKAEINMIRLMGGNLVGHTNYPECVLARELAICYATVGIVSNYAAGMPRADMDASGLKAAVRDSGEQLARLYASVIAALPEKRNDMCYHALDNACL